jgi:hypothetical protein
MKSFSIIAIACAIISLTCAVVACSLPYWMELKTEIAIGPVFIAAKESYGPFRTCLSTSGNATIPELPELPEFDPLINLRADVPLPESGPQIDLQGDECRYVNSDCSVDEEEGAVGMDSASCRKINASRSFLVIGAICAGVLALLMTFVSLRAQNMSSKIKVILYIVPIVLNIFGTISFIISFALVINLYLNRKDELKALDDVDVKYSLDLSASFYLTLAATVFTIVGTLVTALRRSTPVVDNVVPPADANKPQIALADTVISIS